MHVFVNAQLSVSEAYSFLTKGRWDSKNMIWSLIYMWSIFYVWMFLAICVVRHKIPCCIWSVIAHLWKQIVPHMEQVPFFSLSLLDWLMENLWNTKAMFTVITLFGITCCRLLKHRNYFSGKVLRQSINLAPHIKNCYVTDSSNQAEVGSKLVCLRHNGLDLQGR